METALIFMGATGLLLLFAVLAKLSKLLNVVSGFSVSREGFISPELAALQEIQELMQTGKVARDVHSTHRLVKAVIETVTAVRLDDEHDFNFMMHLLAERLQAERKKRFTP